MPQSKHVELSQVHMGRRDSVEARDHASLLVGRCSSIPSPKHLGDYFWQRLRENPPSPDAWALSDGKESLSWAEFEDAVARLVEALHRRAVVDTSSSDTTVQSVVVGVCVRPSVALVVLAYALLECDAVLLPIRDGTPLARLELMLGDAGAQVVIEGEKDGDNSIETIVNWITSAFSAK